MKRLVLAFLVGGFVLCGNALATPRADSVARDEQKTTQRTVHKKEKAREDRAKRGADKQAAAFDPAVECSCDAGKYCLNPRNVAFCVNRKGQKRMLGTAPDS